MYAIDKICMLLRAAHAALLCMREFVPWESSLVCLKDVIRFFYISPLSWWCVFRIFL